MATDWSKTPELIGRKQAASYLTDLGYRTSYRTLVALAVEKKGPPYDMFAHRALYRKEELSEWAKSRSQRREG